MANVALVDVDRFTAEVKINVPLDMIPDAVPRPEARTEIVVSDCCKGLLVSLSGTTEVKYTEYYRQTYPMIRNYLRTELWLPVNYAGYGLLIEAVLYVINDESLLSHVERVVYAKIALQYGTEIINIQRNIRTLIAQGWKKSEQFRENFKTRPKNVEFIAHIADKIKYDLTTATV